MSAFKDYYDILQVSREADQDEIRRSYRKLALEYHPDRNPTTQAHQRFLLIGEAYQVLIDPVQRGRYNLRYDKEKGLRKSPGNASQSYDMVRRKRMSRYNRTGYAQRVRYRGNSSGTARGYEGGAGYREYQEQRRRQQRSYSEAHAERILAEEHSAQMGFRVYARLMRTLAAAVLVLCLGMLGDKFSSVRTAEEAVTSKTDMPWGFTTPGVTKVKTALSTFAIKDDYAKYLEPGDRVSLVKSPLGKVPTQAYIFRDQWLGPLPVYATRYTGSFPLVWALVVVSLITLLVRRNPEFSAYLGTFSLLISIVVLGLVLV